ncbi:hypothetical protein EV2_020486 [Malus domestica]
MANSKAEGGGDYVPQTPHPGKYKVLRRVQKSMVMVSTPGWNPKPICFGTISSKRIMLPLPQEDLPFQTPEQLHDFNTIEEKEVPELMLTKDA